MTAPNMALAPTAPGQIQSANEMVDALNAVKAAIAPDLNPAELKLFAMVAYRSGLDPFARQIHAVKRQGKVTFQTGIDGFRSSAERTGTYDGQDEPEFGPPCTCAEQPKPHPEWARVTVYKVRNGERRPQSATAYWHEFKPAAGSSGNGDVMWKKMPRNQLAKCAEALAFRKAFPYVLADVYSHDEMAQAETGPRVLEHRPTARDLVRERAAEVSGEAIADEVEGTAAEVEDRTEDASDAADAAEPEELTRDELLGALGELNVSAEWAAEKAKELFPERPANRELTKRQRAELLADIRAELAAGEEADNAATDDL